MNQPSFSILHTVILGILYAIYICAPQNKPIFGKAIMQRKLQKKKKTNPPKTKMQCASSLVQQGIWKCAKARHVNNFINPKALFSCLNLSARLDSWLNQTAKRAATPSATQVKLDVAGTRCKPGVPRDVQYPKERVFAPGGEYAEEETSCTVCSSLCWIRASPAWPGAPVPWAGASWLQPTLIQQGEWAVCKKAPSPNLEKYLSTPYSDTLASFLLQLKLWEKPFAKKFCFVFTLLVCLRIYVCGCDLMNKSQHQFL